MDQEAQHGDYEAVHIIVPGAMCTDITVSGLPELPRPGEDAYGSQLHFGPGAKSRNIAEMAAYLAPPNSVAMVSRTAKDTYGLWNIPYQALQTAGVNTDFVTIAQDGSFPAVALVAVDTRGGRSAVINNTVIQGFTGHDIDAAKPLFEVAGQHNGLLVLSMELPFQTALYAMRQAVSHNLRILLDPGGLADNASIEQLFAQPIYLLKPNEHEAKRLTGLDITGMDSAAAAAGQLQQKNVANVLITHGEYGAYLFEYDGSKHYIEAPEVEASAELDATGCGDQVIAAISACLMQGKPLAEAAQWAVAAGTLQYHRLGIQPVGSEDINAALS